MGWGYDARMTTITMFDRDGEEVVLPAKYEVCDRCHGEGYVSKLGAFTSDDLDEWYGDSDERDDFIAEYTTRGGAYDDPCPECKGQRVVLVADESRMTPDQIKEWADFQQEQYESRAADRSEAMYFGYND